MVEKKYKFSWIQNKNREELIKHINLDSDDFAEIKDLLEKEWTKYVNNLEEIAYSCRDESMQVSATIEPWKSDYFCLISNWSGDYNYFQSTHFVCVLHGINKLEYDDLNQIVKSIDIEHFEGCNNYTFW